MYLRKIYIVRLIIRLEVKGMSKKIEEILLKIDEAIHEIDDALSPP